MGGHDTGTKRRGRTLPEKPGIGGGLKETLLTCLSLFSVPFPIPFRCVTAAPSSESGSGKAGNLDIAKDRMANFGLCKLPRQLDDATRPREARRLYTVGEYECCCRHSGGEGKRMKRSILAAYLGTL